MGDMRVDHVSDAAEHDGLHATAERLAKLIGVKPVDGGVHPRFGTRNVILPLANERYVEVVEVLDHPASDKAPFGQAVRARSENGGGWLGWVVSVPDLAPYEARLGREAVRGSRHFPDGRLLEWEQIGVKGLMSDPQLPYFIKWTSDESVLPRALGGQLQLAELEIAGNEERVEDWIGAEVDGSFDGVYIRFTSPNGQPGIDAVTFNTPAGRVRI